MNKAILFWIGLGVVVTMTILIMVFIPEFLIEALPAGLFLIFLIGLAGAIVRGKAK